MNAECLKTVVQENFRNIGMETEMTLQGVSLSHEVEGITPRHNQRRATMKKIVNVKNAFGKTTGITLAFFEDGQAWVYDSVAGHYTTCHSLTTSQISRVKRLACRD